MTASKTRVRSMRETPFDLAIDGLMAGMLLFLPLAFGGVAAWGQQVWIAFVALMGLCVLAKPLVYRDTRWVWTWAYVPIVLFVLLTLFQLLPLPRGVIGTLSPATVRLKDELLPGTTGVGSLTLTFYAYATHAQLRLLLAVAVVFVVVLHAYRSTDRIRRLLVLVTVAGLVVTAMALFQDFTRATLIYGVVPVGHKNAGPFLNYSHFSQFMNLSIGAAVGLIAMTLAAWRDNGRGTIDWADELGRPGNAAVWAAATLAALGPVALVWAMSRMGILSMLVAGAVTAGLIGWRGGYVSSRAGPHADAGRRRGGAGGVFLTLTYALAALAVLLAFGFDAVYDRLGSLRQFEAAAGGRDQILRDLLGVFRQFPLFGTGLGTHEFVFPQFSRAVIPRLFTHAENEYAQLMEESGGVGLLLALAFLAVVGVAFARAVRSPRRPVQFAAFGLGFGLVAILLHSFTDFGQHVPANATLTAIAAALLINLATKANPRDEIEPPRRPVPFAVAAGVLVVFAGAAGWAVYRADVARRADAAYRVARELAAELDASAWQDEAAVRALLTAAGHAAGLEPTNVVYAYWLNAYRWRVVARDGTDPATGLLSLGAESVAFARQIVDELDAARALCPSYGPPLCVAGQIRQGVLGDPAGEAQIDLAYRLTPHDRAVTYAAGTLAARRGDWPTARTALGRYVELNGTRSHVVDTYLLANRPDLAFEAASADRPNLRRLAAGLAAGWPDQGELVKACLAAEERMLVEQSDRPDAPPHLFAERAAAERAKGNTQEAMAWYQKAVDSDYGQVDWRLGLARTQAEAGKTAEADRNLRICLRLRPKWGEAESLLRDLGPRPSPSTGR